MQRFLHMYTYVYAVVYMYMPSYTCICRAASRYMSNTVADLCFTQYTVEYDMKPVEYMKGENFTENRGKSRPHPLTPRQVPQ